MPVTCGSEAFETAAFNHSATSPRWREPHTGGFERKGEYSEGA